MLQMYVFSQDPAPHVAGDGDRDLFTISPSDESVVMLKSVSIGNAGGFGIGHDEENTLRWKIIRGHTTVGNGGSVRTVVSRVPSTPTSGLLSLRSMDENIASGGTPVDLYSGAFNVRTGTMLDIEWPDAMCPWTTQPAGLLVFRLMNDLAANIPLGFNLTWGEITG